VIPNHESPDEPIFQPHMEDWPTCSHCDHLSEKTDYCPVCGCQVCPECWEEHGQECETEPRRPDTIAEGREER
jgi:hypothetical protein